MSYERAEYPFKQATAPLDPAGRGYTLRHLQVKAATDPTVIGRT